MPRVIVARPPRICCWSVAVVTGRFCRSCSEVMRYCGACATSGYCNPVSKFSQKVGAIWPLPDSVSSRLLAMSC